MKKKSTKIHCIRSLYYKLFIFKWYLPKYSSTKIITVQLCNLEYKGYISKWFVSPNRLCLTILPRIYFEHSNILKVYNSPIKFEITKFDCILYYIVIYIEKSSCLYNNEIHQLLRIISYNNVDMIISHKWLAHTLWICMFLYRLIWENNCVFSEQCCLWYRLSKFIC